MTLLEQYAIVNLVVICLYAKTIFFGLVIDDNNQHRDMQKWRLTNKNMFRKNIFYGAGLFKDIQTDHAFTILLTCILGTVVMWNFGLYAALFTVVNPLMNQVIVWLNGRRYLMSLILGLLALKLGTMGAPLYCAAIWVHPIAMPIIGFAVKKSLLTPIVWLLTASLALPKIIKWCESRKRIYPLAAAMAFHPGKIVMAVKSLADYWVAVFWHPVTFMYHPSFWGINEIPGQKEKAYGVNMDFYRAVLILLAVHLIPSIFSPGWLRYALLADAAIFMWLGFWRNYVMYWASRYAGLFTITIGVAVSSCFPDSLLKWGWLFIMAGFTFKNLEMYRNQYSYQFWQVFNMPFNQNAAYSALFRFFNLAAMNYQQASETEDLIQKRASILRATTDRVFSDTVGFYWCMHNSKADLIHREMRKRIFKEKKKD